MKYQSDVIIIGGGLAGVVAALELLDGGKKVLIIDRDKKENLGGLAKWAFGGMFFVGTKHQKRNGFEDSIDLAMKDWFGAAEFANDEVWGRKWAEQFIHTCTSHGYDWLRSMGISFFPVVNWVERGLKQPGNSVPRFHMVWGTGWELVKVLNKRLLHHPKNENLQLVFDSRVNDLVLENGRVVAVIGQHEETSDDFLAEADQVIVATGGINGSIERVKQNWHKDFGMQPPEIILNGSHKFAIGDLHDAVERVEGQVVNLNLQWNYAAGIRHPRPRKKDHALSLVPCPSSLWLNYKGERMGPTPLVSGFDTRYLVERSCQEPVKYSWQVMNQKIAFKEFAISGSESNTLFRDKKMIRFILQTLFLGNRKLLRQMIRETDDIVVGRSLEELADKMNSLTGQSFVTVGKLKNSILPYDQEIQGPQSDYKDIQIKQIQTIRSYRGTKTRTAKFEPILKKSSMPLIAIRNFIVSRKSMGGIQTDLDCRVLGKLNSEGNQPTVPGLYAIGEAAGFGGGGMHGKRSLEGTFLGGCVITGRKAAESILR